MKPSILFLMILILFSCVNPSEKKTEDLSESTFTEGSTADFTLVFASCNHQDRPQPLWQPILDTKPDMFIWGGDNVYADTDDMVKMKNDYDKVSANPLYTNLVEQTTITGTWDDHDFGKNDGGVEWEKKDEAKTILLDFLGVPEDDPRRSRDGVYFSDKIQADGGTIKIIALDTRYFRSPLKRSEDSKRRYDDWEADHDGTMLGETQWKWLEEELRDDTADFTLLVTSIQFLSKEHGWEKWHNFPSEVKKMRELLKSAKAKNIIMLSGDRHMAEISVDENAGLDYPLIDLTSSGLTHTWPTYDTEANEYRVSNIIKRLNFSVLFFDFEKMEVTFEIRGRDNFIFERFIQQY
jgi:alkaline phosphatase D